MPIQVEYLDNQSLLVASFRGLVTRSDLSEMRRAVLADDSFRSSIDRLIYIGQDADLSEVDRSFIISFKQTIIDLEPKADTDGIPVKFRSAFVSLRKINDGVLGLYQAHWDTETGYEPEFRTFDNIGSALEWLGRKHLTAEVAACVGR